MGFFKKLLGQETKHVMDSFTSYLITFDPTTASEAQMEVFKEKFNDLSLKVATSRNNFEKAKNMCEEKARAYQQRVSAAEILEKKYTETKDVSIEKSLNDLLSKLEELKPEVEAEKQDCKEAEETYNELSGYLTEFVEKMESAQKAILKAKNDMARASVEKERAQVKSEAAEIKSGISSDKSDLNVVLSAFTKQSEKDRNEASAANLRADSLTKTDIEKEDANISAALKEAAGETEKPKDLSSRLVALKG
jgi:chromosome segregation ATPase